MKNIFTALAEKISRERIRLAASEIHLLEGDESYQNFRKSTDYCLKLMQEAGFEQVERIPLPADGETVYFDCIMPQAWDTCGRSFLTLTDPAVPPEKRLLADTLESAFDINVWSAPTPPGGIDAPVISWETAEKDPVAVSGKFVFINRYAPDQYKFISDHGAAGLITSNLSLLEEYPHSRRWCNGTGFTGWYHAKGERRLPIFSLRADRADFLQTYLKEKGISTIHALAQTRISDGEIYTLTGLLPGKSREEITLIAHMYEPFLPDDAAGGVIICELARALKALISEGILPPLERSLRIVLSMERYGYAHFFLDEERNKRTLTVISLDSACHYPGSSTFPETKLRLSSIFCPSFLDLLLPDLYKELLPKRRLLLEKGSLSDDTFCSDDWIGIPSCWLHSADGRYHHSTCHKFMDADWDLAADITRFTGAFTALLATGTAEQFENIHTRCRMLARQDLTTVIQAIRSRTSGFEAAEEIRFYGDLTARRLLSLNTYSPGCVPEKEAQEIRRQAEEAARELDAPQEKLSTVQEKAARRVVKRLQPGCLMSLARVPLAERKNSPIPDTLYILLDGSRNVYEAVRLFQYAQGQNISDEMLSGILDYLDYLEKYGYITSA